MDEIFAFIKSLNEIDKTNIEQYCSVCKELIKNIDIIDADKLITKCNSSILIDNIYLKCGTSSIELMINKKLIYIVKTCVGNKLLIICYTVSSFIYDYNDKLMYFTSDDQFEASTHKGIKWLLNQKATKSANN